jgi:CRISPR system Cascade subunit CasC
MLVEIHMIQNVAPSCLNRDDTNSPKDCEFGGHRRARISSQCLKRAVRTSKVFKDGVSNDTGIRTKMYADLIKRGLTDRGKDESLAEIISKAVATYLYGKMDDKGGKVLMFLSHNELGDIHKILTDNWDTLSQTSSTSDGDAPIEKKPGKKGKASGKLDQAVETIFKSYHPSRVSPDVALFGRMVTEKTDLNVDAACQVAHAISTNKANIEMDFFTAVDDLKGDDDPGAGMMGTIQFTSPCFYRYSVLDSEQLRKNLGGDAKLTVETVIAFVKASIRVLPSGKQNSMAAWNPPSMVLVCLKESGQPMSLANAFVKPVSTYNSNGRDLVQESIVRALEYQSKALRMFGRSGLVLNEVCLLDEVDQNLLKDVKIDSGIDDLVSVLEGALNERLGLKV